MMDFILASVVTERADQLVANDPSMSKEAWIGSFYGDLNFWISLCGLLIQMLFVSRIFRLLGIMGALLFTPIVVVTLFSLLAFIPIFSLIWLTEITLSSLNYSLRQTTHHSLFLPTNQVETFEGKTTIDTFFWRFGDLLHGGIVYIGANFLRLTLKKNDVLLRAIFKTVEEGMTPEMRDWSNPALMAGLF